MKILHVMPSLARSFGGPTQSFIGYALAAKAQGISVEVLAPRVSAKDQVWLAEQMPDIQCRFFDSRGSGAVVLAPRLVEHLQRKGGCHDVIHVHGLFNLISSFSLRTCIKNSWPVVIRPFGTLSRYTMDHRRSGLKKLYMRYWEQGQLKQVNGFHFTTEGEEAEASHHGVDFSERRFIIPPPLRYDTNLLTHINEEKREPQVIMLSRLHPVKNIEMLLEAWKHVVQFVPNARLVLAGSGEKSYETHLRKLVHRLGIAGHVQFAGFVSGRSKTKLLLSSTLFVLPSNHENFGVAVLEALMMGLPVVISDEVQLAPYVQAHKLGHVVSRNPDEIASAILKTIMDKELQVRCRESGPNRVQDSFSQATIGKQLASMYETVLSKSYLATPAI